MIAVDDVNGKILYQDSEHMFIWLGADPESASGVVQTNQYLIIDKGRGMLLDPGGIHLFARVVAVASRYISLDKIDLILFSHQDPDVSSGIALWLGVTPAKIYVSSLWLRFLPHFGIVDQSRIVGIEEFWDNIQNWDQVLYTGSCLPISYTQREIFQPLMKGPGYSFPVILGRPYSPLGRSSFY
jgi:Uncharacterized flavoproteins